MSGSFSRGQTTWYGRTKQTHNRTTHLSLLLFNLLYEVKEQVDKLCSQSQNFVIRVQGKLSCAVGCPFCLSWKTVKLSAALRFSWIVIRFRTLERKERSFTQRRQGNLKFFCHVKCHSKLEAGKLLTHEHHVSDKLDICQKRLARAVFLWRVRRLQETPLQQNIPAPKIKIQFAFACKCSFAVFCFRERGDLWVILVVTAFCHLESSWSNGNKEITPRNSLAITKWAFSIAVCFQSVWLRGKKKYATVVVFSITLLLMTGKFAVT